MNALQQTLRRSNLEQALVAISFTPGMSITVDQQMLGLPAELPRYAVCSLDENWHLYVDFSDDPGELFRPDAREVIDLDNGDRYEVQVTVSLGDKVAGPYSPVPIPDTLRIVEYDPAGVIETRAQRAGDQWNCERRFVPAEDGADAPADKRQRRRREPRDYTVGMIEAASMYQTMLAQIDNGVQDS